VAGSGSGSSKGVDIPAANVGVILSAPAVCANTCSGWADASEARRQASLLYEVITRGNPRRVHQRAPAASIMLTGKTNCHPSPERQRRDPTSPDPVAVALRAWKRILDAGVKMQTETSPWGGGRR